MYSLRAPRTRMPGVLLAVGMHVAVVAAVWNYQPPVVHSRASSPIMVSLITTPELAQPVVAPPEPPKPKVKPRPKRPRPEKPTVLSTPTPAPTAFETAPPPEPQPEVAQAAPIAAKEEPAPPPVQPPNFNADYLQNPAPIYPPLSRRLREQGKVMLRVLVGLQGHAEKVELDRSSGSERLDRSALDAVKRWKFVPARQGTVPIAAWVRVPISFSLES